MFIVSGSTFLLSSELSKMLRSLLNSERKKRSNSAFYKHSAALRRHQARCYLLFI